MMRQLGDECWQASRSSINLSCTPLAREALTRALGVRLTLANTSGLGLGKPQYEGLPSPLLNLLHSRRATPPRSCRSASALCRD